VLAPCLWPIETKIRFFGPYGVIPLNSEPAVANYASAILARTEQSMWMSSGYMPRTRDMSLSRRTLLRAWCRKVLARKP
jgi:hypothetical protein